MESEVKPPVAVKLPPTLKAPVVVALVLVELRAVKFWRVVLAVVWRAPFASTRKSSVPAALLKRRKLPAKEVVLEALMRLPLVVVAKRPKSAFALCMEALPMTKLVVRPFG